MAEPGEPRSDAHSAVESAGPVVARARRIRDYFSRYRLQFGGGMLFLVLTQAFALSVPQLLRKATDGLVDGEFGAVRQAALLLVGVAVGGSIARIASRILIFNSGRRVEFDVRNDLFGHLSSLPPSYFSSISTGQIMSRAINDLQQVRLLLGPGILNVTNTSLVYIVVVPLLLATDFTLAVCTLAVLPLLVLAGRLMGKKMYEYGHEAQERLGALSNKVQENLGGFTTVRVFRREDAEIDQFQNLNRRYYGSNVKLARLRGILFPTMGLFGAFGGVILLYLGGQRMIAGVMTVGEFVQFNAYLALLIWPTVALGWMIALVQRGRAAMERINEVFTYAPTIVDGSDNPPPLGGTIEVRNLSISFEGSSQPALRNLSCRFEAGQTIVIVGRTGSGKSTLLKAIARLVEIDPGTVFMGDEDVVDVPLETVRNALAYAPQEAFLFSRTIAENIRFGRADATRAQIEDAVRRAGLDTDIDGFPDGLDTMVGERGVTLSGGQRQRTALARALLLDAPILLLDDTLAAVDTETETRILEELSKARGQTTILVTHRLAGAANADQILVMDEGEIVERGTEAELLDLGGIYAKMHERQRLREQMEAHSGSHPPARAVGAPV